MTKSLPAWGNSDMGKYTSILTVILLLAGVSLPSFVPPPVRAWSTDPTANTLISKGGYFGMAMCSDGSGGVVIAWADLRSTELRAQKFGVTGLSEWTHQGVAVCTSERQPDSPAIVIDGFGGAIIAWRGDGIRAQRLNDSGERQWADEGVALFGRQDFPIMASDGHGGAIIAWQSSGSIYTQRLSPDGMLLWGPDGVAVCTGMEYLPQPVLASDGDSGAIIAWYGGRGEDIYAQRVDAEGVPQWAANGEVICSVPGVQRDLAIASDGSGGAIIAWNDKRSPDGGIYGQRINSDGGLQWNADGVMIRRDAHSQPATVGDGSGGVIIALATGSIVSGGEESDIYAQKLDSDGTPQWTSGGVAVCTAPNNQVDPVIVSDGSGGAVIAWQDGRISEGTDSGDGLWDPSEVNVLHNDDIYAQRLNSAGNPQWASNGVAVTTAPHLQRHLRMVGDGSGGAVVGWGDFRDYPLDDMHTDFGYFFDWYVQGIDGSGNPGAASSGAGLSLLIVIAVALGAVCGVAAAMFIRQRRRAQTIGKGTG